MSADADASLEEAYGLASFDDLDAALAERPDAVFVTNPNSLHVPVALAAARAGLPPLRREADLARPRRRARAHRGDRGAGPSSASSPTRCASTRGSCSCGACCERRRARDADRRERRLRREPAGWHPYEDYRQFHVARSDQGGGVLLAQIHDLDLVHALFGMPRRVFALGGQAVAARARRRGHAPACCSTAGSRCTSTRTSSSVRRCAATRCIGEDGTATWDQVAATLVVRRPDGGEDVTSFAGLERNELFLAELRHFLACLAGDERPVVDARAGAESLKIALAAKRSLETGEVVTLG